MKRSSFEARIMHLMLYIRISKSSQRLHKELCAKEKFFQIIQRSFESWKPKDTLSPTNEISQLKFSKQKNHWTRKVLMPLLNVSEKRTRERRTRQSIDRWIDRSGTMRIYPMSSQLVPGRVISVRREIYREHGCELMPIFVRNPACLSAPTNFASRSESISLLL